MMLSGVGQEKATQKAADLGAQYFMLKPFELDSLTERIREFGGTTPAVPAQKAAIVPKQEKLVFSDDAKKSVTTAKTFEMVVTNIIHEVGVPAHIKGYQFIRSAILMAIDNMEVINHITKQLYPDLAKMFKNDAEPRGTRNPSLN